MYKSWHEVTARDREEWQASHERKVAALKVEFAEYLLLAHGEKFVEIDHLFALACDRGCPQRVDSCGSGPEQAPKLRYDKVCDLFVARTLRLLLNEVRALREDVQKRRDQTNPPHQPQLESSLLLEEVRNLRQDIGHVGQSLWLKELKELRQGLIPLQRANHFMYVSYACLGVLVLLLFK
jgi:hypothetical protein